MRRTRELLKAKRSKRMRAILSNRRVNDISELFSDEIHAEMEKQNRTGSEEE